MPRHERRLIEPVDEQQPVALWPNEIVHNYRVLRGWTQEIAATDYGVSIRTWQRYESSTHRVPKPLLKQITAWVRRACPEYLRYVA